MKFRFDLKILLFLILFFLTRQLKLYLIVLGFAFLHEMAHLLVGVILGFKPKSIEFMPFGFWISLRPKRDDYKKQILKSNMVDLKYIFVAMAGPLLNLIFVFLFGHIFNISEQMLSNNDEIFLLIQLLIFSNFLLFILNIIPIYPLDGGRIMQSFFKIVIGRREADKIINLIANFSIVIFTAIGSIAILYLKNIAVLLILIYLWDLVVKENKRFKLKERICQARISV